jgi:outer membrane protein assembly factor BamB
MGPLSAGDIWHLMAFMGLLHAPVRSPSATVVLITCVAALLGTPHCEQPTEMTLSLHTNVPCTQLEGVTITVGPASSIETMAPGTVSQACSSTGDLGTIVVVPGGARNAAVDVKVVAGVNRDPTTCNAPAYGTGCIVARRSLDFIPHTPLVLDISLSQACNGVVCATDDTCVEGACTSSQVQNPLACTDPGACSQSALTPTNAPPEPPSPLVCGNTAGLQAAAAWPMMGYCPTHIGRGPHVSSKTGHVRWTTSVGAGLSGGIAVAADGTIYAGSDDGKLHAITPSGSIRWSKTIGSSKFVNAVPAIGQDGSIYLGNQDTNLYAVSSSGTLNWKYAVGGQVFTSANVASDGTIYVGGGTNQHSAFALDGAGSLKWTFKTGSDVNSSPAIGFDDTVYVGSEDANIYALGPSGAKHWAFDDQEGGAQTPVIGQDGTVFFNGKSSMCGVDTQGKLAWVTPTSNQATIPAIGFDGTVYAGTTDGGFYAFDGTRGKIKWHLTSLGDFDWANQPTIGGDGTIYIGTTNGFFYALTPSGVILWKLHTAGAIHGPAAIAADGTLYFGSDDQKLYAIGL